MNKIFNFMRSKVFSEVFKKYCENLIRWTWKPELKNFVHLILKTRDYEDSASMFRFFVSHHKKRGVTLKKYPIGYIRRPLFLRFNEYNLKWVSSSFTKYYLKLVSSQLQTDICSCYKLGHTNIHTDRVTKNMDLYYLLVADKNSIESSSSISLTVVAVYR